MDAVDVRRRGEKVSVRVAPVGGIGCLRSSVNGSIERSKSAPSIRQQLARIGDLQTMARMHNETVCRV